ncbi:MAG: hypothetical protein Q7J01_03110 [Syntrophales bacterium]|nr:hypothetical protein [Syntrophales bacterium]
MTDFDYLRIAKWVLIVLLAGFIGQFGKSLAKHLMEKARLKKKGSSPKIEASAPIAGGRRIEGTPDMHGPPPSAISAEEKAKQDKKLVKTLVKQKKKEAKALKK